MTQGASGETRDRPLSDREMGEMSAQHHAHAQALAGDDSPTRALGIIQIVEAFSYVKTISACTFSVSAEAVDRIAHGLASAA